MKFSNLAAAAAAVTLVAAPVAAQAAPQRAAAPTVEGSEVRGGASAWVIGLLALVAIITAIIIATKNHNNPISA
jgi:hypothetical protein